MKTISTVLSVKISIVLSSYHDLHLISILQKVEAHTLNTMHFKILKSKLMNFNSNFKDFLTGNHGV
jgi:hypothetical protein